MRRPQLVPEIMRSSLSPKERLSKVARILAMAALDRLAKPKSTAHSRMLRFRIKKGAVKP